GSIINRKEELELATPERGSMVAVPPQRWRNSVRPEGKLSLVNRRRAPRPVLRSPPIQEALGRITLAPQAHSFHKKRSRLLSTVWLQRLTMKSHFRYQSIRSNSLRRAARGDGIDQNPSSTILPRALPVSSSACARLRFAALMVPKWSAIVVRILPASTSAATL